MRVALVRVDGTAGIKDGMATTKVEHLGLGYLAAYLRRAGHCVRILDAELLGLDDSRVTEELSAGDWDLVGFTMPAAFTARATIQFLSRWEPADAPRRRPHITVGGNFATAHAGRLVEKISTLDSVVLSEGEETLCELAQRIESGRDWQATPGSPLSPMDGSIHRSPVPGSPTSTRCPSPPGTPCPIFFPPTRTPSRQ